MPTGYTADIKDGITFNTFALNCARAFGACIMLRDEPAGGDKIPEQFEVSNYHAEHAEKMRGELVSFHALTPSQREQQAAKAWDDAETRRLMRLEEMRAQRKAYEGMLAQVDAWTPPTAEHVGLRDFMRKQIVESIDFDCDETYYLTPTARLTGEQWAAKRLADLQRDITYHEQNHAEEVQRTDGRSAWVKALRASLPA